MASDAFDDFMDRLDLPETSCDQVHPIVERFMAGIDVTDPVWLDTFSEWMEQANSCLTNEILDVLGELPTDPDELQNHIWMIVRMSWIFYRKFHDGAPFDT